MQTRTAAPATAATLLFLLSTCGGDGATDPGPPPPVVSTVAPASATNIAGTVGQPVAEKPSVIVRDQRGDPMAGVTVTFAVVGGGGTVAGATPTTNAAGVATVGDWTLGTTAGVNTLTATAGSRPPVNFAATAAPGPAAAMEKVAATDNQSAVTGGVVPTPPTVTITDEFGNAVQGVEVTFLVTSGGGSITGATATSSAAGLAAVGSWTLGPDPGENTLTATADGLAGSPATFTANAFTGPAITTITPAELLPGAAATISGSGFGATVGQNSVTVAGVNANITAASETQLTITVPLDVPCELTHNAVVVVTVGGLTANKLHPLRSATARALGVGETLILGDAASARCNELTNPGARYMVSVYNTNRTYTSTRAQFQLRGATAPPGLMAALQVAPARPPLARRQPLSAAATTSFGSEVTVSRASRRMHQRIMEENVRFLQQNRPMAGVRLDPDMPLSVPAGAQVGDQVSVRVPHAWAANFCTNHTVITARVAYVGPRSVIVEDINNPVQGIDSTYAQIGDEFEDVMWDILADNFGDPLAMDAMTSNTGKVVMVFTNLLNTSAPGIGGFVVSCDFFPQSLAPSSNFGQYFYARVATNIGTIENAGSPARWRRIMRPIVIHEAKHVVSFAERIARNAFFEEEWLEEATATVAEELYSRAFYGFAQSANIGYGSAGNPVGPWCDIRLGCPSLANTGPQGFAVAFLGLVDEFYLDFENRSPIGRLGPGDFSFYETGWSLVRWAVDHSGTAEGAFLKALTQTSLRGLDNLEARAGRPFAEMLPEWHLAMALDDRQGVMTANPRLHQPSWDLRDIARGLSEDFCEPNDQPPCWPANPDPRFPLGPRMAQFGSFTVSGGAVPGTGSFIELSGTPPNSQLLELRAGPGVAAPAELRLAIVRIE